MMNKEEIEYCLEKFRDNKHAFRFENGLQISFYKVFEQLNDLQQRIDKAINDILTTFQIISEQPSRNVEEDNFILSRLEGFIKILGGNVDE